jgi:hypothetical protein
MTCYNYHSKSKLRDNRNYHCCSLNDKSSDHCRYLWMLRNSAVFLAVVSERVFFFAAAVWVSLGGDLIEVALLFVVELPVE